MNTHIQLHSNILTKVTFFSKQLQLKLHKNTGRKLAISGEETIALALFKQTVGIPTKKAINDNALGVHQALEGLGDLKNSPDSDDPRKNQHGGYAPKNRRHNKVYVGFLLNFISTT